MKKTTSKKTSKTSFSQQKLLHDALYKKALGYTSEEVVEEYINQDENLVLSKRKVTSKQVPPDISAVKTLIELIDVKEDLSNMTDEELLIERDKLLKILKDSKETVNE